MAVSRGFFIKPTQLTPARVVSTTNLSGTYFNGPTNDGVGATLTLSSNTLTVDNVLLALNDSLLLVAQSSALQNGIYFLQGFNASGNLVLQRREDFQSAQQIVPGYYIPIAAGSADAGTIWCVIEPKPVNIGVDSILFAQSSGVVTTSVTLSQAQVQGMSATPVQIVPAAGAGTVIVPSYATLYTNFQSSAFANGGVVVLQWDNTALGAGTNSLAATFPAAEVTAGASQIYSLAGKTGSAITGVTNKGLFLSNQTGAFTGGSSASALTMNVDYVVIVATV